MAFLDGLSESKKTRKKALGKVVWKYPFQLRWLSGEYSLCISFALSEFSSTQIENVQVVDAPIGMSYFH